MVVTLDGEAYEKSFQDLAHEFHRDVLRCIVARAEGTEIVLIAGGSYSEFALPWDRAGDKNPVASLLEVINIIKTGGTAGTFDLEIRSKAGGTGLDVIFEDTGITPPYHKELSPGRSYLSEEAVVADRGKIVVAIQPVGGTFSGKVRIYGRPLR